jgi:hypothetical protein
MGKERGGDEAAHRRESHVDDEDQQRALLHASHFAVPPAASSLINRGSFIFISKKCRALMLAGNANNKGG